MAVRHKANSCGACKGQRESIRDQDDDGVPKRHRARAEGVI